MGILSSSPRTYWLCSVFQGGIQEVVFLERCWVILVFSQSWELLAWSEKQTEGRALPLKLWMAVSIRICTGAKNLLWSPPSSPVTAKYQLSLPMITFQWSKKKKRIPCMDLLQAELPQACLTEQYFQFSHWPQYPSRETLGHCHLKTTQWDPLSV